MSESLFREAAPELETLRDFLRFAVSRFNAAGLSFGHGSDNPYDEAAYLILHTLHLPLDRLDPFLDARLTPGERAQLLAMLERRVVERVPAAYLTHEAWLGEFRFYVDERVIVPRSFIAELLRDRLDPWVEDPEAVEAVLDMCTGSGCLAILAAHVFPNARVEASDVSSDALAVAARNVADYHLGEQVRLVQSDLWDGLTSRRYDIVVTNPPYVTALSMEGLPAEYRHEPRIALESGTDGLAHIRGILDRAHAHLNPGGLLVAEIGWNRDALEEAFPQLPFTWLETAGADESVFLLRREELVAEQ